MMDYISTKELAKRWNVSITRILNLANEGRLPGAKLVGKSWVFPGDLEKPEDKRRKKTRDSTPIHAFRFPIYFYTRYSQEEIDNEFSADEKTLYDAERLFFNGQYRMSVDALVRLIQDTKDTYVRCGALYCYCLSSMRLHRYQKAYAAYKEIKRIYENESTYKKELKFLVHDLETYFEGNRFYLEDFKIDRPYDYPEHMKIYLLLESAYSDMLKAYMKKVPANPIPYALCLEMEASVLSPLSETLLRMYLAGIYHTQEDHENCVLNLREACRIAEENGLEHSISYLLHYARDIYQISLRDEKAEQLTRLEKLSEEFIKALNGLFEYTEKNSILQNLDARDSSLILYAQKGLTNKEIASITKLSMTTISKKYSKLYEKTMTHSKSELVRLYNDSMLEF